MEKFVELFDVSFAIIVCTLKYIIVDCEAQRKEQGKGNVGQNDRMKVFNFICFF